MAEEKKSKDTQLAEQGSFAAMEAMETLKEAMADDCAGLEFSFDRIKIPSGGATQFELPSDDAENVQTTPEIKGVILFHHPAYAYYQEAYTGGNNPPDCGSFDGVTGIGTPGGACATCRFNQFGSGNGQAKACKNRRMLYLLREGDIFPTEISVPTGSLKAFTNYVKSQLSQGKRLNSIVTKIRLKKATNSKGITYSQTLFSFDRLLTAQEKEVIGKMTEQIKDYVANLTPAALVPYEDEMVDPETGEIIKPL